MKEIAASTAFRIPSEKSTRSSIAILASSGDTRLGIVGLGLHDGQLVEMPVGEPATDQARQPLTPSHLQAHARMQEPNGKCR